MDEADKDALVELAGEEPSGQSSVDDLQGLLLQVSLAIMMIFMIAFFMFRMKTAREQEEQVMELNRQKLSLACERVAVEFRERYALNVLVPIAADGRPEFAASSVVVNGELTSDPTIREAFRRGAKLASEDYAYPEKLAGRWREKVLALAQIPQERLENGDSAWLEALLGRSIGELRLSVYNVQRSCAARLQRDWLAEPGKIGDAELAALAGKLRGAGAEERLRLASEISGALKSRSLMRLSELAQSEMLP